MASLPPRPVFTNLGNAAPTYNGHRNSNQRSSTNSKNSPSPGHYHPYARRSSTPSKFSPIPPWRRDRARQKRRSGPPGHHHPHQVANQCAGRTGDSHPSPTTTIDAAQPHQLTVYQSGPVMYGINVPSHHPLNTPRATGPASAGDASGTNPHHPTAFCTTASPPAPATPPRCLPTPSATTAGHGTTTPQPPTPAPATHPTVALAATLGEATQTLHLPTQILPYFTTWPHYHPHSTAPQTNTNTTTTTTPPSTTTPPRAGFAHPAMPATATATPSLPPLNHPLRITLTPHAPLPPAMSAGECEAALDAVQVLLRVLGRHGRGGGLGAEGLEGGLEGGGDADVDVDVLWRLAGLREALGLTPGWVAWLRGCMRRFVGGLGGVPGVVDGWVDGWEGVAGVVGGRGERLERALGACKGFGWVEEARAVMGRAAYVWRVGDDGEVLRPDEGRVDGAACGKAAVAAVLAAREQVLGHVFTAAQQSLYKWTVGIGNRPCRNITCNTHRMAALGVFLLWSGLYPRTELKRSLQDIISALQYITATDAELAAVAIEHGHKDEHIRYKFLWAAQIREVYDGSCNKCDEKTTTSMLFPLEDLMCDLTSELRHQLVGDV